MSLLTTLVDWFLRFWSRLVMTTLGIAWTPFWLLYCALFYVATHGWALALAIAAGSCLFLSLRYSGKRRRSATKFAVIHSPVIINEVFNVLPAQPKNGWNLEAVSQGVRVYVRNFPSLSDSPTLIAASTFIDSKPKSTLKYLLDTSELITWFGRVHGQVQKLNRSHSTIVIPCQNTDTVTLTLKKESDNILVSNQLLRQVLQVFGRWLPFYVPLPTDYSSETLERTWAQNDKACYILSAPAQATPTVLPFQWSLCVISPVPKHSDCSVLTMIMCSLSLHQLQSAINCLSFQLCSLRDHSLMKQFHAYSIDYTAAKTPPASQERQTRPRPPRPTQEPNQTPTQVDTFSPVSPVSNSPYSEYDQRYRSMALNVAENLITVANATVNDGWSMVGVSKGVTILKKIPQRGDPPINCVKGSGKISCPPEFLMRYLMDASHARELDDMMDKMTIIETLEDSIQLVHMKYKGIWPTTARDFSILNIFGRLDKHTMVHSATSVVDPRIPEERGSVRGEVLSGGYVIRDCPGQPNLSHVTYMTQVDLKGNVPQFVVNKVCESQPQCINHFRQLAEAYLAQLQRNPVKLKQFEDQFPIPNITHFTSTPMNSLTSTGAAAATNALATEINPSLPSVSDELPYLPPPPIDEVDTPPPSPHPLTVTRTDSDQSPPSPPSVMSELEETYTADEDSESTTEAESGHGTMVNGLMESSELGRSDTFNSREIPSLPIETLLDKIPRYQSDGLDSDESNAAPTSSVYTSAIIDYPRTEEGIDYRTMGNQNAARLLEEMFHISELDLLNPATHKDLSNGWKFQGIEKDVVILKKKKLSESPFHSFIGKGLIDLAPQEVYNCVRNPNQRYVFDNMLKELHVVKQIEPDLYILHMQHETNQCFLRQSRDFCILVCERSEPNKKIIVGASVEVPECPPQPNCSRGKIKTSGWVIEPYRYNEKLLTQVTYMVQVDMGGVPAALVNFVSRRQPLAVAYIRDYLETTSLNSNRNGKGSRPSLLDGDPPSDMTFMFKKYM